LGKMLFSFMPMIHIAHDSRTWFYNLLSSNGFVFSIVPVCRDRGIIKEATRSFGWAAFNWGTASLFNYF
jgi:hypothetical protein